MGNLKIVMLALVVSSLLSVGCGSSTPTPAEEKFEMLTARKTGKPARGACPEDFRQIPAPEGQVSCVHN